MGAVYRLGLKALVAPTMTGRTARLLSAHRPNVPILALSTNPKVVRECALLWGVCAEFTEEPHEPLELIELCAREALRKGLVEPGRQDRHHCRRADAPRGRHEPVQGSHGRAARLGLRCSSL